MSCSSGCGSPIINSHYLTPQRRIIREDSVSADQKAERFSLPLTFWILLVSGSENGVRGVALGFSRAALKCISIGKFLIPELRVSLNQNQTPTISPFIVSFGH